MDRAYYYPQVCINVGSGDQLEVAEGYEGEDWADEVNGDFYMPEAWYEEYEGEEQIAHNISPTHWMPLPEPPAPICDDREGGRTSTAAAA